MSRRKNAEKRSPSGPSEGSSSEKVEVEMGDGLTGIFAGIDDAAIAVVFEAELFGEFGSGEEEFTGDAGVIFGQLVEAIEGGFGDDEDVRWGGGSDVAEGIDVVVFVDFV